MTTYGAMQGVNRRSRIAPYVGFKSFGGIRKDAIPPAGYSSHLLVMVERRAMFLLTVIVGLSMSVAIVTLSSQGQLVIPKEIRNELHWKAGTELTLISNASGVTLKALPKPSGRNLADLIGMLKHDGPALSTEELCKPVELTDEEGREDLK